MPGSLVTVKVKFKKKIDKDTGCMSGFDLEADGFYPTWAYRTGGEHADYWEFDIVHKASGYESHVTFPWTVSLDVLETLLHRELMRLIMAIWAVSNTRK